jgi:hypothetical protein
VIIARYEKQPCKECLSSDGLGCKSQHNREVVNNGLEFLHSVEEAERNTRTNAGCNSLPSLYDAQHFRFYPS